MLTPATVDGMRQHKLGLACPAGGVVRCRRPSLQSQENGTTQGKDLVWTSYTAKDGSKKSTLAVLARLIKVLAPVATLTGSTN